MIKLYRTLLCASAVTLLVAGCASGPSYKDMASSIPTLNASSGRLYFFRSDSIVGAGVQPDIKVNGKVVGRSIPGGFFYVDEPPGEYTVSTQTETEKTLSLALDAGETKYVRTAVGLGVLIYRIVPSLESADTAMQQIEDSKYAVSVTAPQSSQ